uniref:Protein CBFA2T3 n=1 Tax=Amazona collaria TaxID=241587 RepID=A0A8B9FES4_9PSIT
MLHWGMHCIPSLPTYPYSTRDQSRMWPQECSSIPDPPGGCQPHAMNGSSHSPNVVNKALSTPSGFSNGPATSSTSSTTSLPTHQLPLACSAHQLSKLERFLIMLQQFRVRGGAEPGLSLQNSTLTIEEFHTKLQEATNFPLRPFVIPFLKANLLLQQKLLHCTCMAKQILAQYLAQHEQLLLDANISPINSSDLLLEVGESSKRRTPDRTKENGLDQDPLHPKHLSKWLCTMSPVQHYSPSNGLIHPPNGLGHPPTPHQHPTIETCQEEVIYHQLIDWEWAEGWKRLNNACSKNRQPLTVLRQCQEADCEELNHWIRHYSNAEDMKKGSAPSAQPHNISSTSEAPQLGIDPRDTHREFTPWPLSGYMPEEIWRKAEEAMNEVKRQAVSELQKAVSYAERKAHKLITTERDKMERALAEAKCQASEDALTVINQQEDWSESCWNCRHKASETCSDCNTAHYCGSFCQHKDWEKHHHICRQTLQGLPVPAALTVGVRLPPGPGQPDGVATITSSPREMGLVAASCAGMPATLAPLESASH